MENCPLLLHWNCALLSRYYMGLQTTSSAPVWILELFTLPEDSGHCAEKRDSNLSEILH